MCTLKRDLFAIAARQLASTDPAGALGQRPAHIIPHHRTVVTLNAGKPVATTIVIRDGVSHVSTRV
ncbi:hypothetical protein BH09GEM1_BH09GEM1_48070 [soil metagenome]